MWLQPPLDWPDAAAIINSVFCLSQLSIDLLIEFSHNRLCGYSFWSEFQRFTCGNISQWSNYYLLQFTSHHWQGHFQQQTGMVTSVTKHFARFFWLFKCFVRSVEGTTRICWPALNVDYSLPTLRQETVSFSHQDNNTGIESADTTETHSLI